MHVISKQVFLDAMRLHPQQGQAILDCYTVLKRGSFNTPAQMKQVFKSLDNFKYRDKWWVINIAGNHLRLIAFISFSDNRIFVKHIVGHAAYEKLSSNIGGEAHELHYSIVSCYQ